MLELHFAVYQREERVIAAHAHVGAEGRVERLKGVHRSATVPSGLRTATDMLVCPLIMTPSRIAWPP